jgi:hypothetical protein
MEAHNSDDVLYQQQIDRALRLLFKGSSHTFHPGYSESGISAIVVGVPREACSFNLWSECVTPKALCLQNCRSIAVGSSLSRQAVRFE